VLLLLLLLLLPACCLPAATVLGDAPFPRLRWRVFNVWPTYLRGGRRRVWR
jgi:hypothetical protein